MPNENGKKVKANGGKEYQSKPFSVWRASGKTAVTRVCKILDRGMLPAKKRDQTKCVKQMMETMAKTWCQDDKVWKLRECLHIESKRQHAYDEAIALACTKLVRETKQKGG